MDFKDLKKQGISLVRLLQGSDLLEHLDPYSIKLILRRCELREYPAGKDVIQQGMEADYVYFVVSGRLQVSREEAGEIKILGDLVPGDILGETALITNRPRMASARALADSILLRLSRSAFEELLRDKPDRIKPISALITERGNALHIKRYRPVSAALMKFLKETPAFKGLSTKTLRDIEPGLKWLFLPQGDTLMNQGDPGEGMYIVIGGRLAFFSRNERGEIVKQGEFRRGDMIGELALVTGENRSATVRAARDSELISITNESFDKILKKSPGTALHMTRVLAQRLSHSASNRTSSGRFSILTILPLEGTTPEDVRQFSRQMEEGLAPYASVRSFFQEDIEKSLGKKLSDIYLDEQGNAEALSWLSRQESQYDRIILIADFEDTRWTERCLRQADRILLLGRPGELARLTNAEAKFLGGDREMLAEQDLVLLHEAGAWNSPRATGEFLRRRTIAGVYHARRDNREDFSRLARILTGRGLGLVLSGGGARGIAHIGFLQGMDEEGMPIDMLGGTSAGALIGGGYALYRDTDRMRDLVMRFMVDQNPLNDYTFPFISLVRGRNYSNSLRQALGDVCIEDLTVPFFAASCNLTEQKLSVFDRGPLWESVRASSSLPGMVPPFFKNGNLYVDGGLLNNLPADVMRDRGAGRVIAVDVVATKDINDGGYRALEGKDMIAYAPPFWKFVKNRFRKNKTIIPSISDILMRSIMLGSLEKVKNAARSADVYARLPIEKFGMLEWDAIEELIAIGREYVRENIGSIRARLENGGS